jgi:multiple sugar transport system substrate-binding protein
MNKLATSRRCVLSGGLAIAAGLASVRSAVRGRAEEQTVLAVAMLDHHWETIEDLAEGYATDAGIELKATPLGYDELYTQLSLALTQRASTFDVVLLEDSWIPQLVSFLVPLDVPSDEAAAFVPTSFALGRNPVDRHPCALPRLGERQIYVLRPESLERASQKPPESWDDTVECATTIAGQLDPDGELAAFGIRSLDGHQLVESFLPVLRGFGKDLIDRETSVPQLDTDEALAAMEAFLVLAALSPVESPAVDATDNGERFGAGQISMMANFWSSDLLASRTVTANAETGPLASMLQPAQSGGVHRAMTGVWLAGIPAGSLAVDAARGFLAWLSGTELQGELPGLNLPPVRTDVLQDPDLVRRFPDLPVLHEMLDVATSRPRSPFYPQLEQLVAAELQRALSGEVSGEQAMKNANVSLRQFLVREGVLTA